MMKASTFIAAGWDFDIVWRIDEGVDYPVLRDLPFESVGPTTFAEWLQRNHVAPDERGATDDPGGFGITNLERYALGLHPNQPHRGDLPLVATRSLQPLEGESGEYLTITFWEPPEAGDIGYTVQVSSDLQTWKGFYAGAYRTVERWDIDRRLVTFRDTRPIAEDEQRFLRVGIWLEPVGEVY